MGRRYLIILDDMWGIEVWNRIRHFFPNYKDGSRIIATTRQLNSAFHFNNSFIMHFLDEVGSWNLFSRSVFGEERFRHELEDIGKKIASKCRGLPLSIVTIGGFLAKSEQTREYWEHIEENLNSIVILEDGEYCLEILKLSYNHLPVHLKPCFLYMGVFEEDIEISVPRLTASWVSEGLVEPTNEESLDTIANEYFVDLVYRNLIIVHTWGSLGKIVFCKIHDLLRNLCQIEAAKERFYGVVGQHIPQGINSMRRVVVNRSTSKEIFLEALESMPHARSLTCCRETDAMPPNLSLLRVARAEDNFGEHVFELVNLREIYVSAMDESQFPSSLNLLWNLEALYVFKLWGATAAIQIWNMPYLRHFGVKKNVRLLDPPIHNVFIMDNLQTLGVILNFKLSQEITKRIPNIKELVIEYDEVEPNGDYYCLNNLECLHKLETFFCDSRSLQFHGSQKMLSFPQSLKQLALEFSNDFELEKMLQKIGSLPLLRLLDLTGGMFRTGNWETVEGQFRKLAFLQLKECHGLKQWMLESSHFPLLEQIRLYDLGELKEIPSDIGDISMLRWIRLRKCSESVLMSAKKILEEQEEVQGKVFIRVQVFVKKGEEEALLRFEGPNFKVICED